MRGVTIKHLSTLCQTDVNILLDYGPAVAIVGSGVSAWEPTQVPTGQEFVKGIWEALFQTPSHTPISSADWDLLYNSGQDSLLRDVPFEMVLDLCPDQTVLKSILSHIYSAGNPNPIHDALAKLVLQGMLHSIITTNYDLALDNALSGSPLARVVSLNDITVNQRRIYFKVHGSANTPNSMVYSLTLESKLPDWKRSLLANVVAGRPILLIGYSGFDFELCPEITQLFPSRVIWNFFSEDDLNISPGLKHILSLNIPKFMLIGDMCLLFNLLGTPVAPRRISNSFNVAAILRNCFTQDQLMLWRIRVLNSMGHARLSRNSLIQLSPATSHNPEILVEYSQCLFHLGKYKLSASQSLKASRLPLSERFQMLRILDASDALRCHGRRRYSRALVKQVLQKLASSILMYPDIKARALLKHLLLLRNTYDVAKRFKCYWICNRIMPDLQQTITQGAPLAIGSGQWKDFQQFRMWADRIGIPDDIFRQSGQYAPLPSREGYRHLGYHVALMMEFLDRARNRSNVVDHDELQSFFARAEQFENHPTAWKIARIAMKRFPTEKTLWHQKFRHHFGMCQYTPYMRILLPLLWI